MEEDLLTAFREFKPDLLLKTQSDRMIRKLEPPIVKLAKSLRIEGDEGDGGERPKPPRYLRVKHASF